MDQGSAEEIARDLVAQHTMRRPFSSLAHRFVSREDCYDVQHAYVAMLRDPCGGEVAGYKIGLPTRRMQAMCGFDEPTAGVVLAERVRRSGARISAAPYGRLGLDSELCVVLDRDLDADPDREEVERSLRSIHAAFEIIDDRDADFGHLDALSLIADNSWNEGVVLGDAASPAVELAALGGRLSVDGAPVESGSTGGAMGHPLDVVVWLARHLARRGERLRAGQLVMTGSIVPSRFPKPGESYEFEIEGLPPVSVEVRA